MMCLNCGGILLAYSIFALMICGSMGDTYYIANDDYEPTTKYPDSIMCTNLKPQPSLDILKIMGPWYGSEIIKHTHDVPGIFTYEICVHVQLIDITEQMQQAQHNMRDRHYNDHYNNNNNNNNNRQYGSSHATHQDYAPYEAEVPIRYLRLIWTERDENLEYNFNYTLRSPGLWLNNAEQRGSMAMRDDYKQFHGTVQVVKAVNDHLVLTFCGTDLRNSVYSIVLTRHKQGLSIEELHGIRGLLSRRGLDTGSIRKVCASSAAVRVCSLSLAALLLLMCIIAARKVF